VHRGPSGMASDGLLKLHLCGTFLAPRIYESLGLIVYRSPAGLCTGVGFTACAFLRDLPRAAAPPFGCVAETCGASRRLHVGRTVRQVPSASMRCRTTASLRASATLAFLMPALSASRAAQLLALIPARAGSG
jgi:hypothetical protein